MAEYSIARGWKRAIIVKDKHLLAYFQNVADLFEARYTETRRDGRPGGRLLVVLQHDPERHQQGQHAHEADVIAFPTAFDGLAPFVGGLRALGNDTPIINSWGSDELLVAAEPTGSQLLLRDLRLDLRRRPRRGSILVKEVTALNKGQLPATGSFIPGSDLVDALVEAITRAKGSTKGAVLAAQLEKFKGFQTTSGKITYSKLHGVTGQVYRVMFVNNNKAKFLRFWKTKKLATG